MPNHFNLNCYYNFVFWDRGNCFRLIYDKDNEKESESEQNNVKSDNDEFEFIYDEEIAWSVEWTRSRFDKSDKFLTPFISHKYKPTKKTL